MSIFKYLLTIISLLIINSLAFAQAAGETSRQQSNPIYMIVMIVVFILIFYFLLVRPQSKRAKEHRQLLQSLDKGDEVLTAGGIVGKIHKLDEQFLVIKISENVEITVQRNAVTAVLPKGSLKSV